MPDFLEPSLERRLVAPRTQEDACALPPALDIAGQNIYGDILLGSFAIGVPVRILSDACHIPLYAEPMDIFFSELIYSFTPTFVDRVPPTLFF